MNRRAFLETAFITSTAATFVACVPAILETTPVPLKDKNPLDPEDVSRLYPISVKFDPISPTIDHPLLNQVIIDFLPALPEQNNIVIRFSNINSPSSDKVTYDFTIYDFDTTTDPQKQLPVFKAHVASNLTTENNVIELLNWSTTADFIEALSYYDILHAGHTVSDEESSAANHTVWPYIDKHGYLFNFATIPTPGLRASTPSQHFNKTVAPLPITLADYFLA